MTWQPCLKSVLYSIYMTCDEHEAPPILFSNFPHLSIVLSIRLFWSIIIVCKYGVNDYYQVCSQWWLEVFEQTWITQLSPLIQSMSSHVEYTWLMLEYNFAVRRFFFLIWLWEGLINSNWAAMFVPKWIQSLQDRNEWLPAISRMAFWNTWDQWPLQLRSICSPCRPLLLALQLLMCVLFLVLNQHHQMLILEICIYQLCSKLASWCWDHFGGHW